MEQRRGLRKRENAVVRWLPDYISKKIKHLNVSWQKDKPAAATDQEQQGQYC